MSWFSWFFGANVLILWARQDVLSSNLRLAALLWIFFNLSGAAVALMVSRYSHTVGKRCGDVGFPVRYAAVAGVLNALALLGNCILWAKML